MSRYYPLQGHYRTELRVEDVWPDSDADGLRAEIRAQWPQLANALDRHCNFMESTDELPD